jgi:hypothetical protein
MKDENTIPAPAAGELDDTKPVASGLRAQLLDRAKRAKEHAQSSAAGLASKAGELTDQAAEAAAKVKDASAAKLAETIDDFNASLPVLREAGYTLSSVDIGIGLPPKVTAAFVVSDDVSEENMERVMAEHADKKFTLLLMKSLHQAWQLQTKVAIVGLKPKGIAVEIGVIPNVSVRFA